MLPAAPLRRDIMDIESKTVDVSNVIPQGVDFTVENNAYRLIYNYRALKRLSDIYGSVEKAIKAFQTEDIYENVLNFLYAGLCDRYGLKKTDIEAWIGPGSIRAFYDVVYSAVILGFGKPNRDDEQEETEPGEA